MPEFEIVDPRNLGDRYTFSTAVKRGNLLFISGMIAREPATGKIAGKGTGGFYFPADGRDP
ncbi:MAG TPA: hypothetical protein PLR20_07270 [Syntrophales bacterium]|jgi:enamine deaminase RidA (YjgF/YER057c/UK114 family)|nr:hypothetical protein [Syntrophales bacterium]HOX95224.1 hypothetical protein [Syntrophales bacterium]HPI56459.1 hypothetical protein [Syntrophales bacterium]HPN25120.1 hypothetical protein [Syntrophales bacterium]HQM29137.1 hypothetical protein [Syntrophales bacterium]